MKLRFGLEWDGIETATPLCELNSMSCGPMGLLGVLETRLGLTAKRVSNATRILQFQAVLENLAARRDVFYRRSFDKDPIAVAQTLLQWRDQLVEAGWDGAGSGVDSARIRDMAAIEASLSGNVAPGVPDRLMTTLRELESRTARIDSLTVIDKREYLPTLWRQLCDKLGGDYHPVEGALRSDHPDGQSDLAVVRTALATGDAAGVKRFRLRNDGSALFLTAHSEAVLAHGVAQWIRESRARGQTLLIAGHDSGILDRALADLDEPVTGLQPRSCARPISQVLLLALRLVWKPLDPRALLEFLTHPVCPLTGSLRRRLADAVTASPGIGGPKWKEAIEATRARAREKTDATSLQAALQRIDDDLGAWLLYERFDPREGATGSALSACCARVARWAGSRGSRAESGSAEHYQFIWLASLASELADLLGPLPRLSRVQLDRLVSEVAAGGWVGVPSPAELRHAPRVPSPGAVIEAHDTVIWWNFSEPPSIQRSPWSQSELQQLAGHGARFVSPEVESARLASAWLRPVFAARKQLVFVVARQRAGEPVGRHPLHARLLGLIDAERPALPTRDLDAELVSSHAREPIQLVARDHRPLPRLRRWWKLNRSLGPRDRESYTSLEKFTYSPYAWVLRHKAQLKAGPLATMRLEGNTRLKGILLHRLLELLLARPPEVVDWRTTTRPQLDRWLENQWPPLLEQEGASLLLPGKVSEAAALQVLAKDALWELLRQLRAASAVRTETNVILPMAPFFGGHIEGLMDLFVETQKGRLAVVDLKFGGRDIREQELRDNRELQLAVYGYLVHHDRGAWPEGAFYILTSRRLMAPSRDYFPHARIVAPQSSPGGLKRCWAGFERVWRWRRQQLDAGWIEVTVEGANKRPPDAPDSTPPLPQWQATEEHAKYNDFDGLTGWPADA
jgi:hypothetical protein